MRPAAPIPHRLAGALTALLCLAVAGPPGPTAATPDPPTPGAERALWIWSAPEPGVVATALAHRIDDLFVHVAPGGADDGNLAALLRDAEGAGIRVWAMAGAPDWADRPGRAARWVAEVSRLPGIVGTVLDVEPHVLPEWQSATARKRLLRRYLRGVERAARRDPRPLLAAVPFWWDHADQRFRDGAIVEHVLDRVDGVVVMAYRDRALGADGIAELAAGEIAAAGARGKRALVGVQTAPDELDKLTFHEEGRATMERALHRVRRRLGGQPGFGGFAIHHLDALLELR